MKTRTGSILDYDQYGDPYVWMYPPDLRGPGLQDFYLIPPMPDAGYALPKNWRVICNPVSLVL